MANFRVVFHLANLFDLTNVSVQVILFPLNFVLRASLTIFWNGKQKKRLGDVDSLASQFVGYILHITSVMTADLFEVFLEFFQ